MCRVGFRNSQLIITIPFGVKFPIAFDSRFYKFIFNHNRYLIHFIHTIHFFLLWWRYTDMNKSLTLLDKYSYNSSYQSFSHLIQGVNTKRSNCAYLYATCDSNVWHFCFDRKSFVCTVWIFPFSMWWGELQLRPTPVVFLFRFGHSFDRSRIDGVRISHFSTSLSQFVLLFLFRLHKRECFCWFRSTFLCDKRWNRW